MVDSGNRQASKSSRIRNSHIIVTIILAAIGLIAMISSSKIGIKGQYGEIGPGFFPMSLGLVIIILSGVILWNNFRDSYDEADEEKSIFYDIRKVSLFFGLLLAALILMEIIGFFGAMFLFTVGYETFIQSQKKAWWKRIVSGLIISGGIQLMFSQLMVQLPGPFWG